MLPPKKAPANPMTEPQATRPPSQPAHDPHDGSAASGAFLHIPPAKGRPWPGTVVHAAGYSMAGLRAGWGEKAFRTEAILAIVVLPAAFWLAHDWRDWALLTMPVLLVLITELLNSAIEAAIDRFGPEWHALSKKAKDMGSAAVFLALLLCAVPCGCPRSMKDCSHDNQTPLQPRVFDVRNMALAALALETPTASIAQRKNRKADKRPVGNRAAQEGPVHSRAVARATEDHRQRAADGVGLDHAVEVAPASRKLRRVPLQPALAGGGKGAKAAKQHGQPGKALPPACAGWPEACQQGKHAHGDQAVALHDAHGARLQLQRVLQVQAKSHHGRAGQKNKRQGAAREVPDPVHDVVVLDAALTE
ncbi:hypothetical protein FQA39_LY19061 [Lamprigera yunnana]|nr:hypothetical protein FQA39_LY19061 [Lamprigera yunnana]